MPMMIITIVSGAEENRSIGIPPHPTERQWGAKLLPSRGGEQGVIIQPAVSNAFDVTIIY